MEVLNKVRKGLDTVVSGICIFLFAAMVVVGSYQIITRFIFNNPSTISEELLTYTFAWMAMFSSALVFGKRDHMRMSFIVDKLPTSKRKVLEIVIEALIVAFAAIVLIYGGFNIMGLTMTQKTASLGIMMGVVYSVIPICGILITIYGILNIIGLSTGQIDPKKEEV
ncbi:MAG TPA: TRAP transporter small permease [Candidatus Merdenecus merdavium]|nr:TRAP transporter small permease [Candidatus Merdenecus merdavium]